MRILFTFIGGSGHLRPLLPFARAAHAAGHTVAIAGRGGQREEIVAAGFTALQTTPPNPRPADQPEDPLEPIDRPREEKTMREGFASDAARKHAAILCDIARDWKPDVIVRDEVDFGTAIAAETLGIPHATVMVLLAGGLIRPETAADPLDTLRAEYGLAPDPDLRKQYGGLVIMPAPPSLRDPRYPLPADTFWCRPDRARILTPGGSRGLDGEQGTSPVVASSGSGDGSRRPRIYCTLGTIDTFREVFDRVLAAARMIPVDLLVTVGRRLDPASFGPQPANVRIERYVPQDEILPGCDLVIAHGGSGTLIGSLAHGLPSLLIPLGADQPWNADRCVALGTARDLDPITFTPQDTADAILELTDQSTGAPYHAAAQKMQAEINALPGPDDAVAALERLA